MLEEMLQKSNARFAFETIWIDKKYANDDCWMETLLNFDAQ